MRVGRITGPTGKQRLEPSNERNAMSSRPLSPHLQVYRLPLTAILSISHRITGVVLVMGLIAIAAFLALAAAGVETYTMLLGWLSTLPGQMGLWLWIYALVFHACHGVRHLIWDTARGLEKHDLLLHNLIELALSVLLTAGAFMATHGQGLLDRGAA